MSGSDYSRVEQAIRYWRHHAQDQPGLLGWPSTWVSVSSISSGSSISGQG